MTLTDEEVAQLLRAVAQIQAILTRPRDLRDPQTILTWVTEHLRRAPGHRVPVREAAAACSQALGVEVTARDIGPWTVAPRWKSNGVTYYEDTILI
jgi:hypothetical protein